MKFLQEINKKFDELKSQFHEMGQLKSEFDIEKFTIKKEGNFIAHNFHFLMRQYSLALYEAKRILLDREEKNRKLIEYQNYDKEKIYVNQESGGSVEKYVDIEIRRIENEIDLLELSLVNKLAMVNYFEKCRIKLIELNGNRVPTNKQYQKEEPEYWKWFMMKKALNQHKQKMSGITEGLWDVMDQAEEIPVLNEEYQIKIGSKFNLEEIEKEIEKQKNIPLRLKLIGKEEK